MSDRLRFALTDKECFQAILNVLVPAIADWGTLSMVDEKGEIWRAGTAHFDPKKARALAELGGRYPPRIDDPTGPGYVIRTGKSDFVPDYGPLLERNLKKVQYPEMVEFIRKLGVRSKISVPLEAHGKVLGALWLATSDSGRVLSEEDLKLVEEVAKRAATSAYHVLKYARANHALERTRVEREVREDYISQVRHDVLSVLTVAKLSSEMITKLEPNGMSANLARRISGSIDRATEILRKTKLKEDLPPKSDRL